jgi:hypothetical protein
MQVYILLSGYYHEYGCPEESDSGEDVVGIYSTEEKAKEALLQEIDSNYKLSSDGFSAMYVDEFGDESWSSILVSEMDQKIHY